MLIPLLGLVYVIIDYTLKQEKKHYIYVEKVLNFSEFFDFYK